MLQIFRKSSPGESSSSTLRPSTLPSGPLQAANMPVLTQVSTRPLITRRPGDTIAQQAPSHNPALIPGASGPLQSYGLDPAFPPCWQVWNLYTSSAAESAAESTLRAWRIPRPLRRSWRSKIRKFFELKVE